MNQKLDQFIKEYCLSQPFSGSLRVTLRDEIIYQRFIGFADHEKRLPLQDNSMFNFYSLTKPFCAIGLLKLKDKGLVQLDAHPGVYVPEALGFDSKVTIRHLLHHVSGLPDFAQTKEFAAKYPLGPADKIREYLQILSQYPSYFSPGTKAMYANINFVLCALIIENVSGMPYADYMKQEVFVPLGMKTAQIDHEGLYLENRVQGYELDGTSLVPVDRCLDWMKGAGDIIGTLDDVYCLNQAIKHRLLLKPETWDEVLTPSPLNQMGMGCTVVPWNQRPRVIHNGGHKGFRTLHVQLFEDDLDIILLSNFGFGDARNAFSEAILHAFYDLDTQKDISIPMDKGYI